MTTTRYRKKPVEIEAVQYGLAEYADNPWVIRSDELPQWLRDAARDGVVVPVFLSEDYWYLKIQTLEGDMYASPDDWIVRGVKGELYPVKPDIFEATYEAVASCQASSDAPNALGTERCTLPAGHTGRHADGNLTWPALAATEATDPEDEHDGPLVPPLLTEAIRQYDAETERAVAALTRLHGPMADLDHPQHPANVETTARVLSGLHRSAEDTVTRVITLHEQWVAAGPPPLGAPLARWWDARLAELHNAIQPKESPMQEQAAPVDWKAIVERRERELKTVGEAHQKAEQERDGAYRERAHLLALLAALTDDAVITYAPDVEEPGWQIVYLQLGGHQASWHISPRDADLFAHVERVDVEDPRAQWDGHTTEAKYEQIAAWTADLAEQCGPACAEQHTETGRCEIARSR
ncbi:hypothetical protein [Streptomyces sp. NPDC003730]